MKQQCPKCGNWVRGTEKKSLVKRASKSAAKFAIGMLPGGGAITEILDNTKLVTGENLLDNAIDKVDQKFRDIPYEFECPNCGYAWEDRSSSGNDNQLAKDNLLFQQTWDYFFENGDEILSSINNVNAFLSECESKAIISPVPKSELNFLMAFCAYCSIDLDRQYVLVSRKYINRALRDLNDIEYQLFVELINNKDSGRNTALIVPNAIKLLEELKEDQALLNQEWYWGQLQDAINEETNKYKDEIIRKEKVSILKKSFLCIPVFMYFYYKWSNYVAPESWFAMHWNYWYILFMIISGGIFLKGLYAIYLVYSKSKEEWQNEYISQYTPFKWSDLLK